MPRAEGTVDVYLISGFLGSGKTTFLNRLVKVVPQDLTFLILMNEFGDVGLDGTLVEGEDIDMVEISKGSIFCACVKTDFIKALHEIAKTVRPDIMLIETTGVANPSDLDRDLKLPIFGGVYRLQDKFCLVDAANFLDTYESFLAIEKQLASSDVFIINKVDLAEPGSVDEIREIIAGLNPEPVFYETTYAEVPFAGLFRQGGLSGRVRDEVAAAGVYSGSALAATARAAAGTPADMTDEQLDDYIDGLLNDDSAQVMPPDRLMSLVVEWPPGTEADFREWLGTLPAKLVRAKGLVRLEGAFRLFDLVNGNWTLGAYNGPVPEPGVGDRVVVISRPEDIASIDELRR
jgi:Putative GTPases (G3E family)